MPNLNNYAQASQVGAAKMALAVQDLYAESSTGLLPLGTRVDLVDGRSFVYTKNSGVALATAKLVQSQIPTEEDQVVTVSGVVGDQFLTVTFDGAQAANAFQNGYLYVNDDTGEGQMFTVKSHAAGTVGVVVYLYEKLRVAVTAGAGTASLVKHPLDSVIVHPSPPTACVQGVTITPVTASHFFWLQVKGPAVVTADGTPAIGGSIEASAAVDGTVIATAETTFLPPLGIVIQAAVADTEQCLVNLAIPGY